MIVEINKGNIFESDAKILVNPVNCVGVMGGGLAREFRIRFPDMYGSYWLYCRAGGLKPGGIHVYPRRSNDPTIFNVATKDHWEDPSLLSYINAGADALARTCFLMNAESIAVPALGCGLGGLDWKDVKPILRDALDPIATKVYLYEPQEVTS